MDGQRALGSPGERGLRGRGILRARPTQGTGNQGTKTVMCFHQSETRIQQRLCPCAARCPKTAQIRKFNSVDLRRKNEASRLMGSIAWRVPCIVGGDDCPTIGQADRHVGHPAQELRASAFAGLIEVWKTDYFGVNRAVAIISKAALWSEVSRKFEQITKLSVKSPRFTNPWVWYLYFPGL